MTQVLFIFSFIFIYRVTGGSDDWARGGAGIKWVLLFELPGGVYGFMLPPRFIRPVRR